MAHEQLSAELIERIRARANDPQRRNDAASLSGQTLSLESLLGELGSSNPQLLQAQQQLSGFMGQFASVMKGFGVMAPMPVGATGRDPDPLPPPASNEQIVKCEKAIGRDLPGALKQLYTGIADGGFGPGGGLFPLSRIAEEYREMTSEPAGPQNQAWPANLVPLVDGEPGYDCLDLETGAMIFWDPEEIEGYSNAAWLRSFKPAAPNLAAWLEEWLERPTAAEKLQEHRGAVMRDPMETHIKNMIESYGRMTPEERAQHGLPEADWEEAVRKRFGR